MPFTRWARRGTGRASTSPLFSRARDRRRAVPLRRRGSRDARRRPVAHASTCGTSTSPASARAALRLARRTARTRREHGHRFNPNKLLVDPVRARPRRARSTSADRSTATRAIAASSDRVLRRRATTRRASRSASSSTTPSTGRATAPPQVPWHDTVIYELHVKGFTKLQPARARRRCAARTSGLASDAAIAHLRSLGVTDGRAHAGARAPRRAGGRRARADELLGLQHARLLRARPPLRARHGGDAVREFKEMVKRLHAAGIEVVLDVVYNHSCEGDALGPDACASAASTTASTTGSTQAISRDYVDYTRLRQHARRDATRRCSSS